MLLMGNLDDKETRTTSQERDGVGIVEEEQDEDDEHSLFYDKSKSFFDNISCEASERAKGFVNLIYD